MFCNQCGQKLEDGTSVCPNCHANLEEEYANLEEEAGTEPAEDFESPAASEMTSSNQPKPDRWLKRWLMAAIALTIVFGYLFYTTLDSGNKSGNIASRYFVSMVNLDSKAAFQCLDIQKTDWLNPDTFSAYMRKDKKIHEELNSVHSYKVVNNPAANYGTSRMQEISYSYGDAQVKGSYYIPTVEDKGNWKVSTADFLIIKATLRFPKGSKVKINGIELTSKYLDKNSDDGSTTVGGNYWSSEPSDTYVIPELFEGIYKVEVDLDGYEPYIIEEEFSRTGIGQVSTGDMKLKKETVAQLEKQAGEDLRALYEAGASNSGFEKVDDLFLNGKQARQQFAAEYERQIEQWSSDYQPIISMKMTDLEARGSTASSAVTITGKYTVAFLYTPFLSSTQKEKETTQEKPITMSYIREGDKWKLNAMPAISVYYSPYS